MRDEHERAQGAATYRTAPDDLERRRDHLARGLAKVRWQRAHDRGDAEALDAAERHLLRALHALHAPPPKARRVWALRVVSPCTEDWNAMVGDARVRRCSVCDRDVYDLAEMTRPQITALLEARGEPPCTRMRRRADGTLVTADACPPSASRLAIGAGVGLGAAALAVGAVLVAREAHASRTCPASVPQTTLAPVRSESVIMGRMAATPHAVEPRPPWERDDVVEAGFASLAHFSETGQTSSADEP